MLMNRFLEASTGIGSYSFTGVKVPDLVLDTKCFVLKKAVTFAG